MFDLDVEVVVGLRPGRGQPFLQSFRAFFRSVQTAANPFEPYLYHDLTPRVLATPRHFAYMKIAEGCDHPCTFCVIPQYRGKFRSRRFESVIAEATRLFGQGVREINLIGQDTTCYGEDLDLRDGLALLLALVAFAFRKAWAYAEATKDVWPLCFFAFMALDNLGEGTYAERNSLCWLLFVAMLVQMVRALQVDGVGAVNVA